MRKALEAIAADLAEVHALHLDRVKALRRELEEAEQDLASVVEKKAAIEEAIFRAGVFMPMREVDG